MKKLVFLLLLIAVLALPASALAGPSEPLAQPPWAQWPGCPGNAPHCKGPHFGP